MLTLTTFHKLKQNQSKNRYFAQSTNDSDTKITASPLMDRMSFFKRQAIKFPLRVASLEERCD